MTANSFTEKASKEHVYTSSTSTPEGLDKPLRGACVLRRLNMTRRRMPRIDQRIGLAAVHSCTLKCGTSCNVCRMADIPQQGELLLYAR